MLSLYISSPTWLHAVPASLKLTALAAASVLLLPATQLGWLFGTCVLSAAGFLSLGAPGHRRFVWLIKTAGALALLVGVFQSLFSLQEAGPDAAIHAAAMSALRLLGLVLLADLVSVTTPMAELLRVIHWLLAPLQLVGVSIKKLELSIGLMIRTAALLNQRREAVNQAMRARTKRPVGLRPIAPLVRQLGSQNRQLAEALYARQLRQARAEVNQTSQTLLTIL